MKNILNLFNNNMKANWSACVQFIKFGIVGLSNTTISLGIYYIFIFISKDFYLIGNIVGFIVSVFNSYYWNSKYVFKKTTNQSFIKTTISYGSTFVLGVILLLLMVEVLGISEIVAPLFNLLITVPVNFLLNKFWAFR